MLLETCSSNFNMCDENAHLNLQVVSKWVYILILVDNLLSSYLELYKNIKFVITLISIYHFP